jgi:SulP family sulfate permease
VTGELRRYRFGTARGDLIAALTVAALAIPSAMAYAELAGLSPIAGLYALLLPAVAYALLGPSRQLSIGPEGSISALVGACFVVARIVRLGWIADYLSRAGADRPHPRGGGRARRGTAREAAGDRRHGR